MWFGSERESAVLSVVSVVGAGFMNGMLVDNVREWDASPNCWPASVGSTTRTLVP